MSPNLASCFLTMVFAVPGAAPGDGDRYSGPVIDVHLHAAAADDNGPPPISICAGVASDLRYDGRQPWPNVITDLSKQPTCAKPIWGGDDG